MSKWKETMCSLIYEPRDGNASSVDEGSKCNVMQLERRKSNLVFSSYLRLICASFLRKSLWSILSEEGIPTCEQCLGSLIPWQYLSPWQAGSLHLQPSNREGIQTLILVAARYSRSRKHNTMICMGGGLRAFCRGLWLLQPVAYGVSCNI